MYYTYTHSTPDGRVFYVGKGTGHRAYSTNKRPIIWRNIVEENKGLTIKIIETFENENDAYDHEKSLIKYHTNNGADLINKTMGGAGVLGYCFTEKDRQHKRDLMLGYKHATITCPKCGFTGGITATKRWHFEKCRGLKVYKARATVAGKRVFLGNYATSEEAEMVKQKFLAEAV